MLGSCWHHLHHRLKTQSEQQFGTCRTWCDSNMDTCIWNYTNMLIKSSLPIARVMTLSFSLTTFTTLLFCKGVTLQQRTVRQCFASSTKRSCRSDDRAMVRVRPSITTEMSGVVSTLRGSSLYRLTSSSAQPRMDVHASWRTMRFISLITLC